MKKLTKKQILRAMEFTALLREKILKDPYRPKYHFATPGDCGLPGDPNAAFYANGRYHLMYLYRNYSDFYRYGHLSSTDLVHWHMHPDALIPDSLDGGIFSGGAFVDEDESVYITYWALPIADGKSKTPNGGIRIAKSSDKAHNYEKWEKFPELAILASSQVGITEVKNEKDEVIDYLGCTDPSNIWKLGNTYYMQLGALVVLNKFRDNPDAPERYHGDWTELYSSQNLHNWKHLGRFYNRRIEEHWPDDNEDDMCPSFLPLSDSKNGGKLTGKYLQLFISHNKGAQYYIGTYIPKTDGCHFTPEKHGRMSWEDNSFFAPEALIDYTNRQIMWAWMRDDRYEGNSEALENGWCGVFSLPRILWLNEDGELGIAPANELRQLRYMPTNNLSSVDGKSCEISLIASVKKDGKVGLRIYRTKKEYVDVYYDENLSSLVFDASASIHGYNTKAVEYAPLKLKDNEKLNMNIFVDRSVIEVFANDRQAISRRAFWKGKSEPSIKILNTNSDILDLQAWNIMDANFF